MKEAHEAVVMARAAVRERAWVGQRIASAEQARELAVARREPLQLRCDVEKHDVEDLAIGSITHLRLQTVRGDRGLVHYDLSSFQSECRDVAEGPVVAGLQLEPMASVLDSILADLLGWHVLEVIYDAKWRVEKTRDDVQPAHANLRHRKPALRKLLDEVIEQKATLLEYAV